MKTISVNGNVYQMSDKMAQNVVDLAHESLKGKNAIYCLQKGDVIEMRKDIFKSINDLKTESAKYIKAGLKVGYEFTQSKVPVLRI